jgi:hypothetical protein
MYVEMDCNCHHCFLHHRHAYPCNIESCARLVVRFGACLGSLLDLARDVGNPLDTCQRGIFDMLMKPPSQTSLHILWYRFTPTPNVLQTSKRVAFKTLTSSYAQVATSLVHLFADQPFVLMKSFFKGDDVRLDACKCLWACNMCCLEPRMARKLRALWETPEQMAQDSSFWEMFLVYAKGAKISNMHVERLLALIKQCVPSDCGAAHMDIRHRAAHGHGITNNTHVQLYRRHRGPVLVGGHMYAYGHVHKPFLKV